jgi:hypothetical protein
MACSAPRERNDRSIINGAISLFANLSGNPQIPKPRRTESQRFAFTSPVYRSIRESSWLSWFLFHHLPSPHPCPSVSIRVHPCPSVSIRVHLRPSWLGDMAIFDGL